MSQSQQSVCQKLAQITFNDSLSSQSSSEEDNLASFAWKGVDQHNFASLFWDKENRDDHVSTRLINILRLQAESERLSKERKRKRRQPTISSVQNSHTKSTKESDTAEKLKQRQDSGQQFMEKDPFEVTVDDEKTGNMKQPDSPP